MLNYPLMLAQSTVAAAQQDYWQDELFGLDQEQRFVTIIVLIGCLTAVTIVVAATVTGVYHSLNRRRLETEFKQELLDRGLSAEEVVEVIKAAPVEDAASRWVEGWREKKRG